MDNDTVVSTGLPTGTLSVLRGNATYSPRRVVGWWAGASLSSTEWSKLYDTLKDARDEVLLTPVAQMLDYRARTVVQALPSAGGTLLADMSLGHTVTTLLSTNTTIAVPANRPTGISAFRVFFTQGGTGGHPVTWPGGWLTEAGGPAPQPAPGPGLVSEIVAVSNDGGATVRLTMGGVWNA